MQLELSQEETDTIASKLAEILRENAAVPDEAPNSLDSPWLDAQGCADYLSLEVKTVHNYSSRPNNPLPSVQVGGDGIKRYHKEDIDSWMRQRSYAEGT